MIRKTLLLALASALLAVPAQAQSLDDVLENYYEAIGGVDAWLAVNSMRATGSLMIGPGVEAPFVLTVKKPKARMEFTFQGMTGIQAYDGETAWMLMPFMGKTEPEPVPEENVEDIKEMAEIEGELINYEEKGHQVEYVGLDTIEGTEVHHIKLTKEDGEIRNYYLDAEYYIPILVTGTSEQMGVVTETEQVLSDYKDVNGLMFPHSMETRAKGSPQGQTITIELIELNVDVDESIFDMPEAEEGEGQP